MYDLLRPRHSPGQCAPGSGGMPGHSQLSDSENYSTVQMNSCSNRVVFRTIKVHAILVKTGNNLAAQVLRLSLSSSPLDLNMYLTDLLIKICQLFDRYK